MSILKSGDKVKVKTREELKNNPFITYEDGTLIEHMTQFCGTYVTIDKFYNKNHIVIKEDNGLFQWNIDMFYENSKQTKPIIKVKYFDNEIDHIQKISVGDWIDLRSAKTVEMKKGEFKLIPLGIGMILPDGYEANIVPRSSTYKNFKIIQSNHYGVIDNSYSGDDDQWMFGAIALENTVIHKNDRICQFRLNKVQPSFEIEEVEHLNSVNRGGIGSTGVD